MASVFIVDDDPGIRHSLKEYLDLEGYDTRTFSSAEEAGSVLSEDPPDVMVLDLKLPGMDGLAFLEKVRRTATHVEVIIITGYGDIPSAVKAMKLGARDYVKKPFDPQEIALIIQKAEDARRRDDQLAYLKQEKEDGFGDLVGTSDPMQEVFRFIKQVSASPKTTVLIRGETGTGKELVAKSIHSLSPRRENPFIEVNCSAFPETLLESELFGYEPGAFTGARNRKKGLLELAHEGTFFLDEIGDMSLQLQARILKVIEEQTFRRVGGTREITIDIRILSASSQDLAKAVADGTFREELFYRLHVASIHLPPLRERGDDVILLAHHFMKRYNAEFRKNITGMEPEVTDLLMNHTWPGNVRELKNVIERAVLFEKGDTLTLKSVSFLAIGGASPHGQEDMELTIPSDGLSLEQVEKTLIEKALAKAGGNKTRAARLLGISREKLRYRIKKLGVST